MERNVASLETAKRLKAAGFPQETAYGWNYSSDAPAAAPEMTGRRYYLQESTDFGAIAAPGAQELADELMKLRKPYCLATLNIQIVNVFGSGFVYGEEYAGSAKLPKGAESGDTLAEMLSAYWLKLQEPSKPSEVNKEVL